MKELKIVSSHSIHVDSYEDGEGNYINGYLLESTIKANTVKEAIQKYFDDNLYYQFDFKYAQMDENGLHWSALVDSENNEILTTDVAYKQWQKGEKILYSNNILLNVYEVTEVDIEDELMY